ncbi:hypothetical protein AB3S75_031940 [Citrus x aurantiifolia]
MLVSLGYIDVILYEASETEKGKYISEHNISYFHNNSDNHLAKIKVPANCVCTLCPFVSWLSVLRVTVVLNLIQPLLRCHIRDDRCRYGLRRRRK